MRAHFSHLALGNDSTGDVVVLRNVLEGFDGATGFFYSQDVNNDIVIEDYQRPNNYTDHAIELRAMYEASADQTLLEGWDSGLTELRAAAYGIDGILLWEEPSRLIFDEQVSENLNWRAKLSRRTDVWRDSDTGLKFGSIHTGNNLLGMYTWADGSGNGQANGYTFSANWSVDSFAAGAQSVTHEDANSTADIYRDIFWPFQKQVKLSVIVDSIANIANYTSSIELQSLDKDKATVGSASTSSFSTTGTKSVTHTPPADSYYLRVRILKSVRASGTDQAEYTISDPVLRIDGSSEFTNN